MNKYRIRYTRGEEARFLSQLDFMRTMTRALRRAGLPLQYSNGFNPHAVLAVAAPLAVGVTGQNECMDAAFEQAIDISAAVDALNSALPAGIHVLDMHPAEELLPFKRIASADYMVTFESDKAPDLQLFLAQAEIEADKRSKKGMRKVDIRPMIHCIEREENRDGWHMRLQAGEPSLKPELVLTALQEQQGLALRNVRVHRLKLYFDDGTEVV